MTQCWYAQHISKCLEEEIMRPNLNDNLMLKWGNILNIDVLKNKFVEGYVTKENSGLSATAINEYIACSLKFYFNQVAQLKSDEILEYHAI